MALYELIEELTCCCCRELFTDPVTLPCGHNFCLSCITSTWQNQENRESSCPECRKIYRNIPELKINVRLKNIVEYIRSNQPQIFCDKCPQGLEIAVKSCLLCEVSLCRDHLRVHLSTSEEHVLTEPTTYIKKRVCSIHKSILKYYCCDDRTCICESCQEDEEHRGHRVEPLSETLKKKKESLKNIYLKLEENKRKINGRLQSLEEQDKDMQEKAASVEAQSKTLFRDAKTNIKELQKRIQTSISKQKEEISQKVSEAKQQLVTEQEGLSKTISHIEDLIKSDDPLTVVQDTESDRPELLQMTFGDNVLLETAEQKFQYVSDLSEDQISAMLNLCFSHIVKFVKKTIKPDPLLKASVILDVQTASNYVIISEDLKTASWCNLCQDRPDTIMRFQGANQVLSTYCFSKGLQYVEVETSPKGVWIIGMSYPSIDRTEYESFIGRNNKSWGLYKSHNQFSVIHDSKEIVLSHKISSQKFRICVDYEGGQLSFYEMCTPIKHLHTFNAKFIEPLYAIFSVWGEGKVTIKS